MVKNLVKKTKQNNVVQITGETAPTPNVLFNSIHDIIVTLSSISRDNTIVKHATLCGQLPNSYFYSSGSVLVI